MADELNIDWDDRQWLAMPEEMEALEVLANQPANFRSRKPARLIWLYTLGVPREGILADLKKSEATLERHFETWINYGVHGLAGFIIAELDSPEWY